ncbi:hypothetical protein FRB94_008931 [Tulasnella sp. JGI-2019a]|nr:hypothetical protein FRB94_008931 [Tulasnella sp. JGI-2019a]
MTAPPEIWLMIIETLASSTHPSAYVLALEPLRDLQNLCLVNRVLRDLAEPILYSRVSLTPRYTKSFKRVLALDTSTADHATLLTTGKGRFIKSMALCNLFDEFRENEWNVISEALHALRFTLERLLLDLVINTGTLGQPLTNVLAAIQNIQCLRELFLLRPYTALYDPVLGTLLAKGTLRRLFVFGVSVYNRFPVLDSLEAATLDRLVLAFPYLPPTSVATGSSGHNNINRTLKMAKHLLLVLPKGGASQRSVEGINDMFRLQGVDGTRGSPKVLVGVCELRMVIESAMNGEIWNIDQVSWKTYSASFGL